MEVLALYEFTASGEDELSFRKGDILKILGSDDNWYKAELRGNEGFVPKNYLDMHVPRWYCENITRMEAENALMGKRIGSFIIRASQTSKGEYSISVRHEEDVQHFKVIRDKLGNYSLWTEKFKSLNKLVDYYKTTSISRLKQIFLHEEDSAQPQPCSGASGSQTSVQYDSSFYRSSHERTEKVSPQQKHARVVKALYDFKALEPDELDFHIGDIIEVIDSTNDSWWLGSLGENIGLFPTNYVMSIDR